MASGFLLPDLCEYDQETATAEDTDEDVVLTNDIRQKYFDYLHRMIGENASGTNATNESVMKIAQNLEMTALKKALSTMNYRTEMLKAIRDVKEKTKSHSVLEGLCLKETTNSNHSEAENSPDVESDKTPKNTSNDAYVLYNSICEEMEKIFWEKPEAPSSPEDTSVCPLLWNSEYHIQKSLCVQLLNIIYKFNPPKYLQLSKKLKILFNMDLDDKSLCATPEPFDEVQRHCKNRAVKLLKHYIRPYYVHFKGIQNFKNFMRGCSDRLARSTPHIGTRAISKGICYAFDSKEVQTIQDDSLDAAVNSVVKHITNYHLILTKEAENARKKSSEFEQSINKD